MTDPDRSVRIIAERLSGRLDEFLEPLKDDLVEAGSHVVLEVNDQEIKIRVVTSRPSLRIKITRVLGRAGYKVD